MESFSIWGIMILRKIFYDNGIYHESKNNAVCFRNSLNDLFDGIIPNITDRTYIKFGYDEHNIFAFVVEIKIDYSYRALLIPFDMVIA